MANDNEPPFWSSVIWNFVGGTLNVDFCWSNEAVEFFEQKITKELIEMLFEEVKPILLEKLGEENMELFFEEMKLSFERDFFKKRKQEFLKKISIVNDGCCYWDDDLFP